MSLGTEEAMLYHCWISEFSMCHWEQTLAFVLGSWYRILGTQRRDKMLIKMDSLIHQSTVDSQGINMYSLKYLGHL